MSYPNCQGSRNRGVAPKFCDVWLGRRLKAMKAYRLPFSACTGGSASLYRHHPREILHCKLGEAVRYCSRKLSMRGGGTKQRKPCRKHADVLACEPENRPSRS